MATNNPIITASVVDTNDAAIALTGDNKKLIRYFSNAYAEMSATAQNGAAMNEDMYIIRNGNKTGFGKTHTFEEVESDEFTFSAEDSNGNIGRATVKATMVPYIKPTCYFTNNKVNGNGNMTVECSGEFYNDSFGKVVNTLTVRFQYRALGEAYSGWRNMEVTKNGNSYTATATLTGLNYKKKYLFDIRVEDKILEMGSDGNEVDSSPIFHWGRNDFAFEVPVKFNGAGYNGVTVDGHLNVGTISIMPSAYSVYGNVITLGDGVVIQESLGDLMINTSGKVYITGYAGGNWIPNLDSNAVSSYTSRYGWYSEMQGVITMGFYIKATCNAEYNDKDIKISGFYYKPTCAAAGGGMCSGAYTGTGVGFQCFVLETSGIITTRTQEYNSASAGNIHTSASGCKYPVGGGELTLSGTIVLTQNTYD